MIKDLEKQGILYKMTTKSYSFFRLIVSIVLFILATIALFFFPEWIESLNKWWFFPLWLYFAWEAIKVIFPVFHISIASGKHFIKNFKPSEYFNINKIKNLVVDNRHPIIIAICWGLLLIGIGVLYFTHVINYLWIYYFVIFFHMADNICINIWCPFRAFMKNRCCVTCRIYNWDHFMKYSPLIFIPNFFNYTLVILGAIALIQWEIVHKQHPERFYQLTNTNLTCGNCARNCIRQKWLKPEDKGLSENIKSEQ